jgi:capsular exopolysaccharide synthesis family protein
MPTNDHYHNRGFSSDRADTSSNSAHGELDQEENDLNLKKFSLALWRQKWLVLGSAIVFGIIGTIFAFKTRPIYQAKGSILIYQPQSALSGFSLGQSALGGMLSNNYGIGLGSTVDNELQVFRSRRLTLKIADSLLHDRLMPDGREYPVIYRSFPGDSTLASRDTVATRLSKKLAFKKAGGSDVIDVRYNSPSPLAANLIVDITLGVFNELSSRQNRLSVNSAASFLNKERKRVKDSLNAATANLRTYMNHHKLVQIDAQTKQLIQQMADLESRREKARAKLVAANAGIKQYKSELNAIKPGLAQQYSKAVGPDITKLQYAKSELEIEKQKLLAKNPGLTGDSPQLHKLNHEIASYKKQIDTLAQHLINKNDQYIGFLGGNGSGSIAENITNINQQLIEMQVQQKQYQSAVDVIDAQLKKQRAFFNNLPNNVVAFAKLKRAVKIKSELYETISKQYARTSIQEQSQFGLGQIIDNGHTPPDPVKPNKPLYILLGLVCGGILGAGYVFVGMTFLPTIWGADKIRKLQIPLLAVIPAISSRSKPHHEEADSNAFEERNISTQLVTMLYPDSVISESFRRLEDQLIYAREELKVKSVVITGSARGEGKTTAIANLGVVLGEAGYKVILADADLRHPKVHELFGLPNAAGITDLLTEQAPPEDAIQQTSAPGLSLLAAGKRPANAAAMMRGLSLPGLLTQLKERFDFVLIDTAPFGEVTDSAPLLRWADGAIAAARCGKTKDTELSRVYGGIRELGAQMLGMVLTGYNYSKSNDLYPASRYYKKQSGEYADDS